MRHLEVEVFRVLYLNTKHRVTAKETTSVGTLNSSLVHLRETFKGAVRRAAAVVIVAHSHPSRDPTPSQEDRHLTERLQSKRPRPLSFVVGVVRAPEVRSIGHGSPDSRRHAATAPGNSGHKQLRRPVDR